jgi:hypothetical protein
VVPVPPQTAPRSDKPTTGERVMRKNLAVLFAVAVMFAAVPMFGAVVFDGTTFPGFVGKGDVQLAFGWNNPQLQANASTVTFTYRIDERYSAVCRFTTGEGTPGEQVHTLTIPKNINVNSNIAYDARKNSQDKITGFNLLSFGTSSGGGNVPVVGGTCPGAGTDGEWISVTGIGSGDESLYVHAPGYDSVDLQP